MAESLGKMAIVVDDGPGFLVNRLLLPYLTEAMELLLDGVQIERIELVATAFGMAKGPLRLLDEIGLDTALAGGRVLWEAFGDRVVVSPLVISDVQGEAFRPQVRRRASSTTAEARRRRPRRSTRSRSRRFASGPGRRSARR